MSAVVHDLQRKLEAELEKLKRVLQMGYELKVVWAPDPDSNLSGEVVSGGVICIYDDTEEEAISTLRHEFLDYAISQVILPYREVTNKLISLINEDAYKRKERLVEALNKIL